jgi:hypothetical protein
VSNVKYDLEKAKSLFSENGCELLANSYKNSKTPMSYLCSCGNMSNIALADFKRGRRCRQCGNQTAALKRLKNLDIQEKLRSAFEIAGCKLKSDYHDYSTPIEYECSCGRTGHTTWFSFQLGRRCGKCIGKRKCKYEMKEIRAIFSSEGCEVLDEVYQGSEFPIRYRCNCGRESKITLSNFKHGSRCKECGLKKNKKENNHRWIVDREQYRLNCLFRHKASSMVKRFFKITYAKKNNLTRILLGYDHLGLKEHIMRHPNWELVKDADWHIDHIWPIAAFLEKGITDLKIINCLDNLKKSDRYDSNKFDLWLQNKQLCDNSRLVFNYEIQIVL